MFPFNMETAIPCGLIINELVSNALKYAFPNGKGEIYVSLMHNNDNKYLLTIKDNGIGLPEDIDFKNTQSLGFRLINNLTNQLEGKIELDVKNGTKFNVLFEELKYETRAGIKETIVTAYQSRELRRHAKELFSNSIDNLGDMPKDLRELIQDLQVQQIENDMQKEELKRSRKEIIDTKKKYLDLYNSAPIGYFTILENGLILDVNNTGASILGISKTGLIKTSFISFLKPDSRTKFNQNNKIAIENKQKLGYELEIVRAEGDSFKSYIETNPIYDKEEKFKEFKVSIIDVKRFIKD